MIRALAIVAMLLAMMPATAKADGCTTDKLYHAILLRMGYSPVAMTKDDGGRLEIWTSQTSVVIVGIVDGQACWRGHRERWHFAQKKQA